MSIVFTATFLEIISRHVLNKIITCDDKDVPWITPQIKTAIKRNSRLYRKWIKRGRKVQEHNYVREIRNITNNLIRKAKQDYYLKLGNKLSDPKIGPKDFWTAFKKLVNNNIHSTNFKS